MNYTGWTILGATYTQPSKGKATEMCDRMKQKTKRSETKNNNVTSYEKTDHLQENMILQDGVRMSPELFQFFLHFVKVWSFLHSIVLFNYCNDREKEGTPVLAIFMLRLIQ